MDTYANKILGPDLGSGASDPLSDQWEAVEKMIRKLEKPGRKKRGKRAKKKLKRVEEQLRVLTEECQRLVKLETKLHKKVKGKGKKVKVKKDQSKQLRALELQCQQQQYWLQEITSNAFLKLLGSTTGSVNWLPSQGQSVIELPSSRGQK